MRLDQGCLLPNQVSTKKQEHMNEARKRRNQGEGDRNEVRKGRKEGGREEGKKEGRKNEGRNQGGREIRRRRERERQ